MSNYLEEHGYRAYLEAAVGTLEPCPLCNGNVTYSSGVHIGYDMDTGTLRCDECGLSLRARLYGFGMYDPLHAFDSWNTRAERTCHPVEKFTEDSPWPVMVCSECGRPLHYDEYREMDYQPYCGCGAKVVE